MLKDKYRDDIAAQLMKEEEEEEEASRGKSAMLKGKNKHAAKTEVTSKGKGKKNRILEDDAEWEIEHDLEEFDADYWQHFEFYKHFFETDCLSDSLVVLSGTNYEKTRKRKKKPKKQVLTTRHASDANSNDYSSTTTSNDNQKVADLVPEFLPLPEIEETKLATDATSDKPQLELEQELLKQLEECIVKEEESIPTKISEPTPPPIEAPAPEIAPIPQVPAKKPRKNKKRAKKANKAENDKIVAEYEEMKEKALLFFAQLTGTADGVKKMQKPKKSNLRPGKKQAKGNSDPSKKNSVDRNTGDCASSHSATATSHASDSNPLCPDDYQEEAFQYDSLDPYYDGWREGEEEEEEQDPNGEEENYEFCEEEFEDHGPQPIIVLSPFMGDLLQSGFFEPFNKEIDQIVASITEQNKNVRTIAQAVQETVEAVAKSILNGIGV